MGPGEWEDLRPAWVAKQKEERAGHRRARRAKCRICGHSEPLSTVRRARTFRPARRGQPASFIHRECAEQPAKILLICPDCENPRRVYLSARRKARLRPWPKKPGAYAVRCRRCNLRFQGKRQTERLRDVAFMRFVDLFQCQRLRGAVQRLGHLGSVPTGANRSRCRSSAIA